MDFQKERGEINMRFCKKCGSPICANCGRCIDEEHPVEADGRITKFGTACPFKKKKEGEIK